MRLYFTNPLAAHCSAICFPDVLSAASRPVSTPPLILPAPAPPPPPKIFCVTQPPLQATPTLQPGSVGQGGVGEGSGRSARGGGQAAGEAMACSWLEAYYEYSGGDGGGEQAAKGGAPTKIKMYTDYLATCGRQTASSMVNANGFATCIK